MNQIEIFNETNEEIKEIETMKKFIEYASFHNKLENVVFNIIIVSNEKIREINRDYRKMDRPTDVISFALEDEKEVFQKFDGEPRILGDIYISIDKAKEQATLYGHSLKRELCFLSIHGLLHLLGYDHMNEEDEKIMFDLQRKILDGFKIQR